jgi:hypothetical protein
MPVPYLACMALVASIYHLPPRVLPAIQAVEGGQPGIVHHNTNDTEDLGVMQVNTTWLWPLARYTHTTAATVYTRLRDEPCYNVAAAGAIMRTYLDETHGDLMRAVGNYHSHTTTLNIAYQMLVMQSATRLFVARGGSPQATTQRSIAERLALQRRLVRDARRARG